MYIVHNMWGAINDNVFFWTNLLKINNDVDWTNV